MSVEYDWGIRLEVYLERPENLSIRQYPLDRVLSAIRKIATKGSSKTLSDSTLEAFISVVYYPEHLNLLNAKSFRDMWFTLMQEYLNAHLVYDRSFGFLMTQVLGLTTTVGFLAHNLKLEPFVASLLYAKPKNASEFLRRLTLQALQVSKLDTQNLAVAFGRGEKFLRPPIDLVTPGPFIPNIGGLTTNTMTFLSNHLFKSRHKFLSTNYRASPCGWPIVLLVMWLTKALSRCDPDKKDKYQSQLEVIQELVYRYFLVSTPEERPTMEVLVRETAGSVVDKYEAPVDSADARMIVLALTRQLASRIDHPTSQSFVCL